MTRNASTLIKRSFIGLFGGIFLTGLASAQVQTVTGSLSVAEISAGQETVLTVTYTATDASGEETSTTGLGLRLHYDSSVIDMGEIADLLEEGASGNQIKDDVNNDDNDENTDKYLLTTWFDFGGDWPDGETLPVTLYSVPLTAISGFEGSTFKFTASSVAAGYSLSADDVVVNKVPGTISTLSSLTASYDLQGSSVDISLTPAFDSATTDYSASVANPVSAISLVPVLTDSFATISAFTANGSAVSDNTVDLASSGTNNISISVTAEDGINVTTYSVAVDRAAALSVAISALDVITTANAASYAVAGTCNLDGVSVAVSLTDGTNSADANAVDCIDSAWTASVDASGLADGAISVSAVASTSLETDTATATTNKDTTGPTVNVPANITVNADSASGTAATNVAIVAFLQAATASDATDGSVTVTNDAPDVFPLGDTVVTFAATDAAGNQGTASSVVTISDLTPPVINAAATLVVLGTEDGVPASEQAIVDYLASVTATDNVDGALTGIQNDGPDFYPFGETTVTFTVSDAAGNQASAQTVVNISLDIVDPVLVVPDSISLTVDMPGDVVADSDDAIVAFLAGATATDNKDGDLTASIANDAPAEFEVGDTLVTFSVSDAAGNSVSDSATVSVSVLDTDNDGLPDFYETQNGLDPNDASDADSDLDGDGISNLDEYLNGTDPTRDELPPELTIPEDIAISATGRLTDVDIGQAVATDNRDGDLAVSPSVTGPFESGLTEITWAVSDEAGNESSAVQRVEILPLANLTPSSITVEGTEVDVTVQLSGMAVTYPVTVPLTISGTATSDDYVLTDSVVISEGLSGSVVMSVSEDALVESDETVVIALGTPTNAALGAVTERTVTIIEDNVAPVLTFAVSQGDTNGRTVAADAGLVSLIATYTDLNDGDTHTFSWGAGVADLPGVTTDESSISFDPSSLGDTIVIETASVTDSGNPSLTTTASVTIKVLAAAPVLDDSDSDGDGVSDADEGYGDSDDDGIPDYQDNIEESYLAPVGDDGSVAQSAVGTAIALGDTALASGDNQLGVDESDIGGEDADYSYLGGLADFELTGGQVGSSYNIVIPLSTPVPENAVLRKYMGETTGWQDFVEDANNAFSSAIAASGACPEPGSDLYSAGLLVGATCLQLQIEDGGPNDADGEADGTVTDPSGIATLYFGPPSSDSTITVSVAELKAGGSETAEVKVTAVDSDGRSLEGMTVTASSSLSDVTLSTFVESPGGVYTSTLTPGSTGGDVVVTATISNGTDSVSISSSTVVITKSGGGGCTVGDGQSSDWSLILLMAAALMLMMRRRISARSD